MSEPLSEEDLRRFARTFQTFLERLWTLGGPSGSSPLVARVDEHMGSSSVELPVVRERHPPFEHANVQSAFDAFRADGIVVDLVGVSGDQRRHHDFSEILRMGDRFGVGIGSVDYEEVAVGPDETLSCVQFGLYLLRMDDEPLVALVRGPDRQFGPEQGVIVEVMAHRPEVGQRMLVTLRDLMLRHNVFRRKVLSFDANDFGDGVGPIRFQRRAPLDVSELVLPDATLGLVERQVIGIAESRSALLASQQHLKRGLLLHGPPGTGKTHTVRYLIGRLTDFTVVVLTGPGLRFISEACALARALQPALIVLEDVDLVAEDRSMHMGGPGQPLLFEVLNQMDGLEPDADVAFVLTTNRAETLERALVERPGRVDQAVEIDVPDAEGRRRLLALYARGIDLALDDEDRVLRRAEGVTASFVKELVRRSALLAALGSGNGARRLRVTDEHVNAALDELTGPGSTLTRSLLGYRPPSVP
ncbi:MAG TPA: ATP-binding protein [Acidothermales bacterium]